MRITPEEQGSFKYLQLYLKFDSGKDFGFCLCTSPTGFSVNGLSVSNGLFQTINGLRQSVLFPSEAVA